jgi:hypothetical protein
MKHNDKTASNQFGKVKLDSLDFDFDFDEEQDMDYLNGAYMDEDDFDYDAVKIKNFKKHDINGSSKSKKPQWRADRKKAKKFKQEMQGSSD